LDFEQIKKILSNPFEKNYKKRFSVKIGQHLKVISTDEIECFFSKNKGTYLNTFDNRNYLIETTLELLEQELDPKDFYRVSRKFIVPLKAIKEIVVYSNSRLKVILPYYKDEKVIVSTEKVSDFKSWIG
jgi:two-component system response regulator LytT